MKKLFNKRIIIINALIIGLGIIAGIIFLIFTSHIDKLIVKEEITEYFALIKTSSHSFSNLINSFKYSATYITLITIFSIIYIFSPGILFISFYKGMVIGFLMGSVVLTYKIKGIFYSLLVIFPHHILTILLLILYSSIMLTFSYKLLKGTINKENINLGLFIKKVSILYLGALIVSFIISLIEIFISPIFLKLFI